MKVVAVDDEPISLDCLEVVLSNMEELTEVVTFPDAEDALAWFKTNKADVAFLDIEMRGMNGLELASAIRRLCSSCKIIFVTSTSKYALEAFKIHATGYLVKPVTKEAVRNELEYIFHEIDDLEQLGLSARLPKTSIPSDLLRVQCFGNFEVFNHDLPVKFSLSKSKELLAYLIHRRGASCSLSEIAAVLYEDKPDNAALQSLIRNIISDLKKSLESAGCKDILVKTRGYVAILPAKVFCDYYNFLDGDADAVNSYNGEYMAQYTWAEFTVGYLERKMH